MFFEDVTEVLRLRKRKPIRDHDIRLQESMNCSPSKNDVMPIIREVENIEQPDPNAQHGESTKYNGIPVRQPIGGRRRFFFNKSFTDFPQTPQEWSKMQTDHVIKLPTVVGKHPDLQSITPETAVKLIN